LIPLKKGKSRNERTNQYHMLIN